MTGTGIIEWLLDLEGLRLGGGEPLSVEWRHALPLWLLLVLGAAAAFAVLTVYRREHVPPGRRAALVAVRLLLIALVGTLLCGPRLVLQRNRVERSYVNLLIDASSSMATRDVYADDALADAIARGAGLEDASGLAKHSRIELVKAALAQDDGAALAALLDYNDLQVSSFSGTAEPLAWASSTGGLKPALERMAGLAADGRRTDGAGAIAQAIEDARGRRLAAIIIASDGRATESSNLEDALDLARGRQIPIYPLRIGSPRRPRDIDVGPLRADGTAFVKDRLAIETLLTASGLAESTPVTVQLIDEQTKEIVASREITFDSTATTATVELVVQPNRTGLIRYRVEAVPLPDEEVIDNNASTIDVSIIDERLRVLYVEGYPRYEYRYLKNALLREETISLSVLLLEADEGFVQEGTEPIRRFPNTPEELNRYDVVLFGDVDPRGGWLTRAQMKMLLDYVGHHSGGFGLLAGERAAPGRFRGTLLEKLVPVRIASRTDEGLDERLAGSYRLDLTPEGRRSRLFQTEPVGESLGDGDNRERGVLPALYWVARTAGPKPGATVLAAVHSRREGIDDAPAADPMPLVVTSRYGAGNVFFQATDDTWRWRRHTGEHMHDTYWVRVVRELMRADVLAQSRQVVIRTDARVYEYGATAQVHVEALDPELTVANPEKMEIVVARIGEPAEGQTTMPRASRSAGSVIVDRFGVNRIGLNSNRYEATYLPQEPGRFRLTVEGLPKPAESGDPTAVFHVKLPDAEASRREADHAVLERMAGASGGEVIELDELETAFGAIPDRSTQIPNDITEPLWDSKLALMLFLLLMTTEWTLRKALGLL